MNESILRDVSVTPKERERILKSVKKSQGKNKYKHLYYYVSFSAAVALIFILLFSFDLNLIPINGPSIETKNIQSNNPDSKDTRESPPDNEEEIQHSEELIDYENLRHIVFNGYYYIKGDQVSQNEIDTRIGEVKRIGTWEIAKDGDSNEVPPGPIFSLKDRDSQEVIAAKQWANRDV
ncbi:hypothetical protein [Cytobacillus firmus]|uniref:hypothetical protein n=1 Tax=Cytobacillus firmus TaxID=1399 RepID=UPI0024C18E5A|nr:hypothetical protein [Cytobacillus firmus]WHY59900.1 hypothetical protein QNH42_15055 [Cytobacillus firmus]